MGCTPATAQSLVESLVREAVGREGVPEPVARYAAQSTLRAGGRLNGPRQKARCSSYFWACVRRRLLRAGGSSTASTRLVLSSVVADLRSSGRDSGDVWHELQRGWGSRVPPEILEEYRVLLCA
jgi:hypothetical protein